MSYDVLFACGHTEQIFHQTNHCPPVQSVDICQSCQEQAFFQVLLLWDRARAGHGTPEEAAMTLAWYLRSQRRCQVSGVLATLRERATELELTNAPLSQAYRAFAQQVEAWMRPADPGKGASPQENRSE